MLCRYHTMGYVLVIAKASSERCYSEKTGAEAEAVLSQMAAPPVHEEDLGCVLNQSQLV